MHPQIHFNILSIVVAVIASFIFGWLWHGPLFGKLWLRLNKIPADTEADPKTMIKPMLLNLLATTLTSYVLVFSTNVWRPSVWGIGTDDTWCVYGVMSGFFTWLGFYVPLFLGSTAWEGRSWKLFAYSVSYYFFHLQIIAMIVAYMYSEV